MLRIPKAESVGSSSTMSVEEWIGSDLQEKLKKEPDLRDSVHSALDSLSGEYESTEAVFESDPDHPENEQTVIRVKAEVNHVEEWNRVKEDVRAKVREAEKEGEIIYTAIERV